MSAKQVALDVILSNIYCCITRFGKFTPDSIKNVKKKAEIGYILDEVEEITTVGEWIQYVSVNADRTEAAGLKGKARKTLLTYCCGTKRRRSSQKK
jgi:hypothetical protein